MAGTKDLEIKQGKTFSLVLRWETEPIVYKAISAIQQSAPVRLTVAGHGLPDGWRCAITNVKGMTEVNAEANALRDKDYHPITVIDANTLEINAINAAGFKPYISGGVLQCNTPVSLVGYTARMSVKDKIGGAVLHTMNTEGVGITLDVPTSTVNLTISATDTAAFAWKKGVYDLELVSASGVVTALLTGSVVVAKEVTT